MAAAPPSSKPPAVPAPPVGFLGIAAQNFSATIDDTDDLSTIRGSSLAALEAPRRLHPWLENALRDHGVQAVQPISTGASEGLYALVPAPSAHQQDRTAQIEALTARIQGALGEKKKTKDKKEKKRLQQEIDTAQAERRRLESGASEAAAQDTDWDAIARAVEAHCRVFLAAPAAADGPASPPWDRLSFAVAVCSPVDPARETLQLMLRRLERRLNLSQFRRLTVPLPERAPPLSSLESTAGPVCALTGIQPAEVQVETKGRICRSAERRRRYGRDKKFKFYGSELRHVADRCAELRTDGPADRAAAGFLDTTQAALLRTADDLQQSGLDFALTFADLSLQQGRAGPAEAGDPLPPSVRGKMALLYLDGNAFGARCQPFLSSIGAYRALNDYLAMRRARLLATVLDWMLRRTPAMIRPATQEDPKHRLRFETLLWGGDEFLWVLPAAFGWELMGVVQNALADWRPAEALAGTPGIDKAALDAPLTHAAGLLFCDDKAPIRITRNLVKGLADAGKVKDPTTGKTEERNTVQALALEGADWAGIDLDGLRARWTDAPADDRAAFSLAGADWPTLTHLVRLAKAKVGQSQLQRQFGKASGGGARLGSADILGRIETLNGIGVRQALAPLFTTPLLCARPDRFPRLPLDQLLQLWDYVGPFGPPPAPNRTERAA